MTKRIRAKHKIDRRLGQNIWGRPKSPINKRETRPGQHGERRSSKLSDYGQQLRAKQKLKGYYGNLTEKQFVRIYAEASTFCSTSALRHSSRTADRSGLMRAAASIKPKRRFSRPTTCRSTSSTPARTSAMVVQSAGSRIAFMTASMPKRLRLAKLDLSLLAR